MGENLIQVKSFQFSLKLIREIYALDKFQFDPLLKQLLRSGTSVGANIEEGLGAQSKQDFVHKLSIAQKEIRETKYRIRLFIDAHLWTNIDWKAILNDAEEISKIITKILTTSKTNLKSATSIENGEF